MAKNKTVSSTLDQQVFEFKTMFEGNKAYEAAVEATIVAKSMELDRQATNQDISYAEWRLLERLNSSRHRWNWDEAWDGKLIKMLYGLEAVGFHVVSFTRARKIRLTGNNDLTQPEFFSKIHDVVGDVANIKFTRGGTWIQLAKNYP